MKRIRLVPVLLYLGLMTLGAINKVQAGYVDNGNGTVTDQATGLIWEKGVSSGTMNWEAALAWCFNATTGGHSDWRLPNRREHESLVDKSRFDPAIDPAFTGSASFIAWSGTTEVSRPTSAWGIDWRSGNTSNQNKVAKLYVRCVRGGP